MLVEFALFALGLLALVAGARMLVRGTSKLALSLGCLGASGLAAGAGGLPVPPAALAFDLSVMLAATFACLPVFFTGREIARREGGLFIGYYIAYAASLVLTATHHAPLPACSAVMLSFVAPPTIVTLLVSMLRAQRVGG